LQIIKNYISHNDSLQLKNELTDFAVKIESNSTLFSSMEVALDHFQRNGSFTEQEGKMLK
jgi:hypothetical protein